MKFASGTSVILGIILAISLFLICSLFANFTPQTTDPDMSKWIGANLYWSYILLVIAIIAAFSLEFVNARSDKKASKYSLVCIGMLVGVIFLAFVFSDSKMPNFKDAEKFIENGTVTPGVLLWIGTGLITSYILFVIAVIVIIWSSVSRVFNNLRN